MWAHLQRQGIAGARCTVERLMRVNGWHGTTRTRMVRTTVADPAACRAPDLVDRDFTVTAPNLLVVADFTYVRLATGVFVYTAFVIDVRRADHRRGARDSSSASSSARPPTGAGAPRDRLGAATPESGADRSGAAMIEDPMEGQQDCHQSLRGLPCSA
jgi:hypothetical protein